MLAHSYQWERLYNIKFHACSHKLSAMLTDRECWSLATIIMFNGDCFVKKHTHTHKPKKNKRTTSAGQFSAISFDFCHKFIVQNHFIQVETQRTVKEFAYHRLNSTNTWTLHQLSRVCILKLLDWDCNENKQTTTATVLKLMCHSSVIVSHGITVTTTTTIMFSLSLHYYYFFCFSSFFLKTK